MLSYVYSKQTWGNMFCVIIIYFIHLL